MIEHLFNIIYQTSVEDGEAEKLTKQILDLYRKHNVQKEVVRGSQLLDAPIQVQIESSTGSKEWVKEKEDVK